VRFVHGQATPGEDRPGTRDRLLGATAELFRRQGYTGTGLKAITAAAQAPLGSLYHFFPGGKEDLGADVVRWSGARYGELLPAIFDPAPDLETAVRTFFDLAGEDLRASGWQDACPIATVALEVSSSSEPMREACAGVFADWIDAGAERFTTGGIDPPVARELTIAMIAALEGAFVLARAQRSTEPLHAAGALVADRVGALLA
jgi:AcrR family transcriptional regulator